jgi:hypothetical protein
MSELWFDSPEAIDLAFESEPMRTQLEEDRERFIGQTLSYIVDEYVVLDTRAKDWPGT